MELEVGRRKSPQHEARWLNLLGYALRPGYGLAVDDWRVAETWKRLGGKVVHNSPASRAELSILWRRVAGGLDIYHGEPIYWCPCRAGSRGSGDARGAGPTEYPSPR